MKNVASYLKGADAAFCNLETAVSDRGQEIKKRYTFRSPPEAVDALATVGFDVVSLANNHVLDFGAEALADTIARLDAAGIKHAGVAADGCPYSAVLVRRAVLEQGLLDSPEKIRGLKLSVSKDNLGAYLMDKALARVGLNLDDMQVFPAPASAHLHAMQSGCLDIVAAAEPWLTRHLQTGVCIPWATDTELMPGFQHAYIAYGPSLLQKRPDVGRRFMIAYLRGIRQYGRGRTERNLAVLAGHTKLERQLLEQACWPAFHQDGRINAQSILEFQAWAVQRGLLDRTLTAEEFWDPSFVDHADEILKM